jgi:ATPase subunit of ABC transporter with duplicated ATPase domains
MPTITTERTRQSVEENLRSLSRWLETLTQNRDRLIFQVPDPEAQNLQQLNFPQLQTQIQFQLARLDLLKNRFNRDTINIGVIGRAGQGKNLLLQSLTGLSSNEIPTGDRFLSKCFLFIP